MEHQRFPIQKGGIFRPGKEIEGLRGGVHWYAAQAIPKIDAARAEKDLFWAETGSNGKSLPLGGMAEWLKAAVLKTVVPFVAEPWVRILLPPPAKIFRRDGRVG